MRDDPADRAVPLARLSDRFGEEAARCASLDALRGLLDAAVRELGFRHFALLHHASLRPGGAGLVRLDNYPAAWEEEMRARGFVADDPVHLASRRAGTGFSWSALDRLVLVTARHREIFEASRGHGIGDGFTVPVNVPGEPGGSCSFAVKHGRALPLRRLHCAQLIGAYAFQAARRLHRGSAGRGRPHLSRRELQCLHLLAAGKTDWEIAQILGIGTETVRHYVKRARAAYDVVSRTQLVVHGLRDGWIGFEDAIPPSG